MTGSLRLWLPCPKHDALHLFWNCGPKQALLLCCFCQGFSQDNEEPPESPTHLCCPSFNAVPPGRREPKAVLLRPTVCQGGKQDLCWDPIHLEPSSIRAETSTASVASPLWLENHTKFNLCPLPLKGFALQVPLLWEMLGLWVLTTPHQVQEEPYITSAPEHPSMND